MNALLAIAGAVAYLAVAAAMMRLLAWVGVRWLDGRNDEFEIFGGLAWPAALAVMAAVELVTGLHRLATRGMREDR
ncbi:hypothetical protein [Actinomadura rupiterrae]|uniref:hypothetical protein n=1 Tax=Actinomadura rupiterrae TaxID=559627 RepID=UPI0020A2DAF9|nr:hypothetical protein [Actinomadura rupiterrae]MCP2339191.1 hypothetical protein [Actinomadura rupiterrae]